jgi:parafibromin
VALVKALQCNDESKLAVDKPKRGNIIAQSSMSATMSSHTDALLCLRQAIKSRQPISYANAEGPCTSLLTATHLVISLSISLPKSSPTRYRKPGTSSSDFFSVEAVYLAWLLRDAPGAEYMKQARENGLAVGFVSVTERKGVVDWLEGKTADSDRIAPLVGVFMNYPGILSWC